MSGLIVSPVPVQYGSHELQMLADALQAKTVITMPRLGNVELAHGARQALPRLCVLEFGSDLVIDTSEPGICWTLPADDANRYFEHLLDFRDYRHAKRRSALA